MIGHRLSKSVTTSPEYPSQLLQIKMLFVRRSFCLDL